MELDLASSSSHTVQPQKHAVFLSFRGSDTRNTFVSHLYKAFQRQGIPTFLDSKEFERGREISEILTEIESSNVSIIIFSRNYADSPWCLDELVQIMKCKETKGQEVVPVFYHVDPSDLESESGSYGVAIAEHEKDPDKKAKVPDWRTALRQAGSLSGWVFGNDRPEAPQIEKIVEGILKKLKHLCSSHELEGLVGIHGKIQGVEALLHIGRVDIRRVVGIWGMGGVGKTTLARVVFNRCSFHFDGCCFLQNVRERSNIVGVDQLKLELKRDIFGENCTSTMMNQQLPHKKVLIVLDDVDDVLQFNGIIENRNLLGTGSRIVVTSRNKKVLDNVADDGCIHKVLPLGDDEALELFSLRAEKEKFPSSSRLGLASSFVNYAGGNPLAVTVLGGFLYRTNIEEWNSALLKLEKYPDLSILKVLRISYDGLDKHDKQIFLNIACFLKGRYLDEVQSILDALGFHSEVGLRNLVDKSLVDKSSCGLEVDMHDLLKELGKQLVREECEEEPGKRSRLFEPEDVIHVLGRNTGTESVEAISSSCDLCLSLDPTVFMNMTRLKFLELDGRNKLDFSEDLKYLSNELRYLKWRNYPFKSLPSNFVATTLVELDMSWSNIERCWKGVQNLPNLKMIDLSWCRSMIEMPDLSKAPKLKELVCSGCKNLEEVSPSISHLGSLEKLDFSFCEKIRSFPCIEMPNLKTMNLFCCGMIEIPNSLKAPKLEKLNCSYCMYLEEVSPSISHLRRLKELDFAFCVKIRSFPSTVSLMCLKVLSLCNCSNLILFPEVSRNIERLDLSSSGIKEIPLETFRELSSLKQLNLSKCRSLGSLPNSLGFLYSLQKLDVSGSSIESISASIIQLSQLQELDIRSCERLRCLPKLPPSVCELQANECRSLQNVSFSSRLTPFEVLERLNFDRMLEFSFINCIKLDESACEKIFAFAQRSIKSVVAPAINKWVEKDRKDKMRSRFVVPGNEMPHWIEHRSGGGGGPSITIDFQPLNLLGFIFCAVLDFHHFSQGYNLIDARVDIRFEVQLNSNHCGSRGESRSTGLIDFSEVKSEYVVLCYAPYVPSEADSQYSELSATMEILHRKRRSWEGKVVQWGLSLVYKDGDDEEYRNDKGWFEKVRSTLHEDHELVLSRRMRYICNGCNQNGRICSFCCEECDFDLHPNCALKDNKETKDDEKDETKDNAGWIGEEEGWLEKVKSTLHEDHELVLSRRMRYICDGCNEEGRIWSFYCEECNFDLHPNCALKDSKETKDNEKDETKDNDGWIGDEEGWPEKVKSTLHEDHELVLSRRMRYICDGCNEEGHMWSFCCEGCDFDLHPNCALKDNKGTKEDEQDETKDNDGRIGDEGLSHTLGIYCLGAFQMWS